MESKTFEQIAQELRKSADQASLPSDWTANTIDLFRAPCSSAEATAKAVRWSNALPNDPAGNVTFAELGGHFQNAMKDWERASKVVQAISTPTFGYFDRAADLSRQADWQIIRSRVETSLKAVSGPKAASGPPARLLNALDAHIALAKAGKVQEAFAETAGKAVEANRIFADAYAQLAAGPGLKRKNWDDCWDTCAAGAGSVVGFAATAYCYKAAVTATAAGVAVVTSPAWAVCAGVGAVVTGFCAGYYWATI